MVKPTLRRFCGIELTYLAALFVLPIMVYVSLRSPAALLNDPDLWWHIADARILFTAHHFIRFDPYSWTVAGHRWVDSELLAEVPYWLGYHWAGAFGVYFATWALIELNVMLVFFRATRGTGPEAAFWASVAAIAMFVVNAGPRTILAGYILLSLLLWTLAAYEDRRSNLIWLVPVIFAVWVNTHGTWLIGLFLFALYVAGGFFALNRGAFAQTKRESGSQKRLVGVLVLSAAALFLNPYGWRMIWDPLDMMFKQKLNIETIVEWQPLNLSTLDGASVAVVIAIMLVSAMLKGRKWRVYEFLWLIFAFFAAFDHVRFAFLAGVIVAPFLAKDFFVLFWSKRSDKEHVWLNVSIAIAFAALVVYIFPRPSADNRALAKDWPTRLIASVKPGWRTLNEYKLGGEFAFAGKPDFVDSRVDVFERAGVYADYIDATHIKSPYAVLRKYRVNHILFREKTPFGYLIAHSPDWKIEAREGGWVLWKRKTPVEIPKIQGK